MEITEQGGPVNSEFRSGTVALAGRSNVGKSTLLNRLLGAKIAIESERPQATRFRVLGIQTRPDAQLVWVDLPGIHRARSLLNQRMVEAARREIGEADAVVVLLDGTDGVRADDEEVLAAVRASRRPWLVAVNKIDRVARPDLLALSASLHERDPERDVVPVSARTGENLDELVRAVSAMLPVGPALYPEDDLTDQSSRAIVAEAIREKVYEVAEAEVPYRTAVVVDTWTEKPEKNLVVVQATILVERESQKRILVGKGGSRIREIGQRARRDLEAFLERRLFLELFVKVQRDWTRDPRFLNELGIG